MGTRAHEESIRIKAKTANTRERILAIFDSDYHFHGEARRVLGQEEKKAKCNFNVDLYNVDLY